MKNAAGSKYVVGFKRSSDLGMEEHDGGATIAQGRKEAAFFCYSLPADVSVIIYAVNPCGAYRLSLVERVR